LTTVVLDLPDVQRETPAHAIPLDEVGVRGLRHPARIHDGEAVQHTVATASVSVALPAAERGTHMSRLVQALHAYEMALSPITVLDLARRVCEALDAEAATVSLRFPLFLERTAPVSGARGLVDYEGVLGASTGVAGDSVSVGVRAPITSLCPCSKEISDYGAHNQRGYVCADATVDARDAARITFRWLIDLVESAGSAPIYSVLKRADERAVTMQAYDSPAFVEDIARAVLAGFAAAGLRGRLVVDVENHESIHNHAAYARAAASA
jgi:GTP cyclohydrolase FolE2